MEKMPATCVARWSEWYNLVVVSTQEELSIELKSAEYNVLWRMKEREEQLRDEEGVIISLPPSLDASPVRLEAEDPTPFISGDQTLLSHSWVLG